MTRSSLSIPVSPLSGRLKRQLREAGAYAVGYAPLREVDPTVMDNYISWIAEDRHGGLAYLEHNTEIRRNPALLLDGGNDPRTGGTIISMAFPYYSGNPYRPGKLKIARYALGDDYHEVLRRRLTPVARWLTEETGLEARICVDTAPILERYWAREAGIGFIGRNHQLIVPGAGPCFFLAEIVTRVELPPDDPCRLTCGDCLACVKGCPSNALSHDRKPSPDRPHTGFDCRRCHSYLTIEHRGDFPDDFKPRPLALYGCDLCLESCPHFRNSPHPAPLPEFMPREPLLNLTPDYILSLTPPAYNLLLRHSPIKRAKLDGLLRNCRRVIPDPIKNA